MTALPLRAAVTGLLLAVAACAQAATIRVPAGRPTIQAGIEAAAGGDTVLVAPGTYIENIRFRQKSVAVMSEAGPAATIIDGSQPSHPDTGSVAIVDADGALLQGFTITGGTGTEGLPFALQRAAGGVALIAQATVRGNWITENHVQPSPATGGGGVYAYELDGYTIAENRIFGNTTGSRGGGVYVTGATGAAIVDRNEIFYNDGGSGGGIQSVPVFGTTISNNVIAVNEGGGIGGGFYIYGNTVVLNGDYGVESYYGPEFHHNTVTHNFGFGIRCNGNPPGYCNNFFANENEDPTCFGPGTLNISADPLYGDPETFCLLPESPLLPENSPPGCELIGARGLCPSTAVQDVDAPTSPDYASGPLIARPNPFNPSTTISFRLDRDSVIELEVIDARGRLVSRLHQGFLAAGRYDIEWDGRDMNGRAAASAAYIVVLRSPPARFSQKLLLVK